MKKKFFFLIAAIIIISNCGLNYLGNSDGESSETILVLSFNSYSVPNKTIIPDVTMDVVNYNVSGATTTGDNFNETVGIDGVLVLNDLAVGTWVIDVDAQNDADVIIADGNTSVEIQAGQIINKTVTVTPLDGPGTLSLTVDWTDASQFDSATVTGSLTPAGGSAVPITFNPSGVKAAAHTSSQNKGYYLLSTHVEEGSETWNFVDTVRIIYNETTSATIDVPDIENQGGLDLSIDNDLQNPIDITLDGVEDPLISGTNMTVTATCNPEPTTYQWYLDGVLLDGATSSFITIGSTLPERTGAYRLTLIVSLGEILSSESCNFTVADTPFCNLKKLINYDGPGNDMIWGTADDSINSYDLYGYNSDEEQIKTVCYDGPGDDLIWETADDSISKYFTYEYNSAGRMIKYVYYDGPGDDLIWETADDSINSYQIYERNSDGEKIKTIKYNGAGPDSNWFTTDDTISSYYTYEYNSDGEMTLYVFYDGPGPDSDWFTADDSIKCHYTYEYNGDGKEVKFVYYNGAGYDSIYYYYINEYNYDLRKIKTIYYNEAGIDSTWFTADDVIQKYETHEYNSDGKETKFISYDDPGVNSSWFDDDDEIDYYFECEYNSDGQMIKFIYNGSSQYYMTYEYNAQGYLTKVIEYDFSDSIIKYKVYVYE